MKNLICIAVLFLSIISNPLFAQSVIEGPSKVKNCTGDLVRLEFDSDSVNADARLVWQVLYPEKLDYVPINKGIAFSAGADRTIYVILLEITPENVLTHHHILRVGNPKDAVCFPIDGEPIDDPPVVIIPDDPPEVPDDPPKDNIPELSDYVDITNKLVARVPTESRHLSRKLGEVFSNSAKEIRNGSLTTAKEIKLYTKSGCRTILGYGVHFTNWEPFFRDLAKAHAFADDNGKLKTMSDRADLADYTAQGLNMNGINLSKTTSRSVSTPIIIKSKSNSTLDCPDGNCPNLRK